MVLRSVVAIPLLHCPGNETGGVVREMLGARHKVGTASQVELHLRCKTQSRRGWLQPAHIYRLYGAFNIFYVKLYC